jgi:phosphatidate cytidylyltransferase
MLKARILTALCLIPPVLLALFASQWLFTLVVFVIIMAAGWEYARLIQIPGFHWQGLFIGINAASFLFGLLFPVAVLWIGTLWWVVVAGMLVKFPFGQNYWLRWPVLRAVVGWLMLVPCGVGLTVLHHRPQGAWWVLLLLLMIWAADTGAYFAGKFYGKRLLAPLVSPKKTLEGVYGGLLLTILAVVIVGWIWRLPIFVEPLFMVSVLLVFALSVMGDLEESAIKRWMNVKDSGTLLPGHGGLLDRIDSLLAAAPVFALCIVLLGSSLH